ncbi:MAG: peptidylprolyl isomerase [Candidatus Thermoplasmatota archaeon]|jgi:peptidyl-prolyl cis-trans isomerase B (cyclophilin B)|nr:peptidylprolyl isomerase [Candidatus Thermoplasmatota archaeon]
MRSVVLLPILLVLTLLTAAAPAGSISGEEGPEEDGVIYTEPQDIGRPNRIAVIDVTGWGIIKIELYENMTPLTTKNFIDLASVGFYDGINFHRCIDDFVAQTGDPNTKNNNPYDDGSGGSGKTIPLEICRNASHIDGAVGMARATDPATAESQFYICDGPQHGLDDWVRMDSSGSHGYAVFGVVIEGLDVAKAIAACETYPSYRPLLDDHPVDDITMKKVWIEDGVWNNLTEDENGTGKDKRASKLPWPGTASIICFITIFAILVLRRKGR